MPNSEEELRRIAGEIEACTRCPLSRTRTKPVPGEGPPKAEVMFVGEGPGGNEDIEGRPFVGRAGDLLNELLASIRLDRESVYVTNIMKCRPTTASQPVEQQPHEAKDRRPTSEEIDACTPYLERQIDLIQPKVICTLGDTATRFILERYRLKAGNISMMHGRICSAGNLKIVPMYHPAAALYTAQLKATMQRDFRKLAGLLEQTTLG